MKERASEPPAQVFRIHCSCGHKGRVSLRHYEKVRCRCGKRYWALQPHKGGPLELFDHPGTFYDS